jgi:hypothetical protein
MEKIAFGVSLAATLIAAALAQSPAVPRLHLRVVDQTPAQGIDSKPTLSKFVCDSEGNIYFRFYNVSAVLQAPVLRVSSDGQHKQAFSLLAATGFENATITSFAVDQDGRVALAVWGPKVNDGHILRFKSDGTFDSDATIKTGSRNASQIAIFSNGNLLASGTEDLPGGGTTRPRDDVPFTQVLDDVGNVLKDLKLPGDYTPPDPSDPAFKKSFGKQPVEITQGDVVSGGDGYVYLTRRFAEPIVYVIGPDGSLARTLKLAPPEPRARQQGGIYYSAAAGGQLALEFWAKPPGSDGGVRLISTYNAETGERLADYEAPLGIGRSLACFSPNGFTFLGSSSQHQLTINDVKPY